MARYRNTPFFTILLIFSHGANLGASESSEKRGLVEGDTTAESINRLNAIFF